MAMDFTSLLAGAINPASGSGAAPMDGVNVTAPTRNSGTSTDFERSIYNNAPELQMAKQGQTQNPQHSGLFGVHGTLRNVLGVLGDAFLIKDGHEPMYAKRVQSEREADAMTGFQSDPMAAAGRLGALPGGADLADKLYNSYQTQQLKTAQQESNNQYRSAREESMQDQRDTRMRQGIGGVLSAAATPDPKTGKTDPARWAQARALALKMGAKVSDFDESEVPDTPEAYNAGYGQTARQVQQGVISNSSINERATAAANKLPIEQQNANANTARARAQAAGTNRNPTDASLAAPILQKMVNDPNYKPTPAELDVLTRTGHSANRGQGRATSTLHFTPNGAAPPPPVSHQFQEGKTYQDANGNKATYHNGKWIPVQ